MKTLTFNQMEAINGGGAKHAACVVVMHIACLIWSTAVGAACPPAGFALGIAGSLASDKVCDKIRDEDEDEE